MKTPVVNCLLTLTMGVLFGTLPGLLAQDARVQVRFGEQLGPMEIDRMALGQGGLSDQPMWADRVPEIRALRPKLIRLFIQEYFNLLSETGSFHFETLDRSVDAILRTGAKPLMCICFKPRQLFPAIDQDIVEPQDYDKWERLVYELVKHYSNRKAGIQYWEVANEPDIGEDGGCPYRFKPDSYVRYYQHTAAAVLRADPQARVGGPALASSHSAILPVLLRFCETNQLPLHFVSWHIYSSSPESIRSTVEYVQGLLKAHPALNPETVLDEWNMDLMNPPLDSRFQPAFVCETIWQMKEARLDYSCYYHIRDCYVDFDQFRPFMSEQGTAFMTRWWNRMPQFDGLFDYQNQVRPAYYAFKLLSRLAGQQLRITSDHAAVHGFATRDEQLRMHNLVLWTFSPAPIAVELMLKGLPAKSRVRHLKLDALTPAMDENLRLRPDPFFNLDKGDQRLKLQLEPYAVHYWSIE
jgi:xylan 1,4-beta-xylosidase